MEKIIKFLYFNLFTDRYEGELNLNYQMALDIFKVSDYYQFNALSKYCINYLFKTLSSSTVLEMWKFCIFPQFNEHYQEIWHYISRNIDEVISTQSFVSLDYVYCFLFIYRTQSFLY